MDDIGTFVKNFVTSLADIIFIRLTHYNGWICRIREVANRRLVRDCVDTPKLHIYPAES